MKKGVRVSFQPENIFSSYGCTACFMAMASTNWGFETVAFYRVELLTLHLTWRTRIL